MIHGIRLVNFGNHRDSRLEFGAITALVGRNGSGKTTVLRAVREMARIAGALRPKLNLNFDLGDSDKAPLSLPQKYVRKGEVDVGLSTSGPGIKEDSSGTWGLAIEGKIDPTRTDECVPVQGEWSWKSPSTDGYQFWLPDVGPSKYPSDDERKGFFATMKASVRDSSAGTSDTGPAIRSAPPLPVTHPQKDWLPEVLDCQYLHGVGVNLHLPSYTSSIPPKLTSSGDNLPSVIAYLMTSEPERFAQLSEAFCRLIPFVKRIRVQPALVTKREPTIISVNRKELTVDQDREFSGHELLFDLRSGKGISASVVSEGTLLILALLTIFHTTDAPRLVLIDDVEQALHPWAQRGLVEQFRALQNARPALQLILTTHSPYIIDELKPEEVWMLAEDQTGGAVAKRFIDHPDLERAKGVLTTGEFWSSEGEEWIFSDTRGDKGV
jgi:predicted ATPase